MSELTKFECDVSGEWFGAKNDVLEFEIRSHIRGSPFEMRERTVHISLEVFDGYDIPAPHRLKYVGVKDREIVGAALGYNPHHGDLYYEYEERNNVMTEKYESFFNFVEEEIMY